MKTNQKKIIAKEPSKTARGVEDIIGCKWSLVVLDLVDRGIDRPGIMAKSVKGLTTKVLNQRLIKMQRYGILIKKSYPVIPPKVVYSFTSYGRQFMKIVESIRKLESSEK
ncbi:MAG: helix-turn-helix transcriptional regulator [Proteobacteria bacterium]|nr:helix-turn-helix transcriptional regulator [Pseudomonadota bacterium]